jgi:hypothetical protein
MVAALVMMHFNLSSGVLGAAMHDIHARASVGNDDEQLSTCTFVELDWRMVGMRGRRACMWRRQWMAVLLLR